MSNSILCVNARFGPVAMLTALNLFACNLADAKPTLEFDVRRTVECRDVTPPEFEKQNSGMRVIECAFSVSAYLVSGDIADVEAISIEIIDTNDHLRVYDFSPRTRLESEYAEDIQTTRTCESSRSLGASIGGEVPAGIGVTAANFKPTINGLTGGKEVVTDTIKRIAPKQVIVASGTLNNEHGVFFTLRSSPLSSLEGLHEFKVRFVVPATWCSNELQVNCRARGVQEMLWIKRQKTWAQKSAGVTIVPGGNANKFRAGQYIPVGSQ